MKLKKKIITLFALSTALIISSTNVFAYNYSFGETYDNDAFGNATTSEVVADNTSIQNIRRDKNIALLPPTYGIFSGEFDTNTSNPYFTANNQSSISSIGNITNGIYATDGSGYLTSISTTYNETSNMPSITVSYDNNNNYNAYNKITSVGKYSDGSIGTLIIDDIGLRERIYETVELDTLAKGIGHFSETSMWDGNVSLAAHNRGSASYFADIDKLDIGDVIKYTTKEGTRNYKVYSVQKISETDTSVLMDTYDNTITLITCVRNDRDYRWCVKGVEVN